MIAKHTRISFARGRRHAAVSAGTLLLLAGAWTPLRAQQKAPDLTEISLEQLASIEVYAASKFIQKVSDAPASITIITADDIRNHGYRTMADILRSVTGFYVTYDRNYSYIGTRGFGRPGDYNTRLLVLVDGHRLNDNIYGGAYIGTEFPIDVDMIQRVEIVRGPGSSLYGTSAFFGVVNIVTKRGRDLRGARWTAEAGSFSMYQGRAFTGGEFPGGLEMLLTGSYFDGKGQRRLYYPEFDTPDTNNGVAEDADTDRGGTFFANVSRGNLHAQVVYNRRQKAIPTASFATYFNDRRTSTRDQRAYADVRFERTVPGQWDLLARGYLDSYDYDGIYVYDYSEGGAPNLVPNIDQSHGRWFGGEMLVSRSVGKRHRFSMGWELRRNFRQNQGNYDPPPDYYVYMDDVRRSTIYAFYCQEEITLARNLLLSAGVRYDHDSTFGGTTNPRLGMILNPASKTTVKFLYGHAFRAPNFYELYYRSDLYKASGDLNPENIKTSELVAERLVGRHFRVAGSGYYYRLSGLITQSVDPVDELLVFRNAGAIRAHGLEVELEARGFKGVDARLAYAVQRSTDYPSRQTLSNSPQHLGYFTLSGPLASSRIRWGLDARYVGPRETLDGGRLGGFTLVNLTVVHRKLGRYAELDASVYNMLNKRYADAGSEEHRQQGIVQDGRTFRVRMTFNLPFPGLNDLRPAAAARP